MTYDKNDLIKPTHSKRTQIQTANGECVSVNGAGTVAVSKNIHLNHCLLIPNLSHKLLSISQLTKELNSEVLMCVNGCIVQEALTGEIIGHGTGQDGLYYVDEVVKKRSAVLTHGSSEK